MSGPVDGIRSRLNGAEAMSTAFMASAMDRWERDGNIDGESATLLRSNPDSSEMSTALKHLGAHMVLSVAIVVPIPGLRSLARAGWTLTFRVKGPFGLATRRITREEYRLVRSIHTVPVMILGLVPVVGAMAYAVSDPMLKGPGRMLLDEAESKLPFKLYRRMRLARFTAPRAPATPNVTPAYPGTSSR